MQKKSEDAWGKYNALMNELREEIAKQTKLILSDKYSYFSFGDSSFFAANENVSLIQGLVYDDAGVQIRIDDSEGEELECALQSENFEFTDLVNILEILEVQKL